jgi:Flp pilus assembly pilin Flp
METKETMQTMKARQMKHQSRRFRRFLRTNEAVSALEYAMLVGVIAVAISAALVTFSDTITTALTTIGTEVKGMKIGTTDKLD